jgi:hypothetical protein
MFGIRDEISSGIWENDETREIRWEDLRWKRSETKADEPRGQGVWARRKEAERRLKRRQSAEIRRIKGNDSAYFGRYIFTDDQKSFFLVKIPVLTVACHYSFLLFLQLSWTYSVHDLWSVPLLTSLRWNTMLFTVQRQQRHWCRSGDTHLPGGRVDVWPPLQW